MKGLLSALLLMFCVTAHAREIVAIQSPYSASHSGTTAMIKITEEANKIQQRYRFVLEFRPGGEQILAVKALEEQPQSRLAIVAPKFVEHIMSDRLVESDYVPVHALGDACWAVIGNIGSDPRTGIQNLRGAKEIVIGGVGIGNAAHITGLQLADKFGFRIRYVPFKSNYDALILMASDDSVNIVVDRLASYTQFQSRNPKMKVLGMSCPTRHPGAPEVKTLKEQGVDAPYVFNITVAHKNMDVVRRQELVQILETATKQVGNEVIRESSDMTAPYFGNVGLEEYYSARLSTMKTLLRRYSSKFQNE